MKWKMTSVRSQVFIVLILMVGQDGYMLEDLQKQWDYNSIDSRVLGLYFWQEAGNGISNLQFSLLLKFITAF